MVRPFQPGRMPFLLLVHFALLVPAVATAAPQTAQGRVVRAQPTDRPPVLDGRLDEPEWETAEVAGGFVQAEPREGQPLTERTEVRVLFDREYLYIGAYCFDSNPARIIVNELRRDFDSQESDAFGVALDVLHDRRNSFSFFTNPGSAKRDAQSLDDGRHTNVQWDGVWEVRSAVHADGWVAEIAIPFKTLGLRSSDIEAMGINFKRRIRRNNEEGYWSPVPRRFTINYVSLAGTLTGLGSISGGGALRVKPFATVDMRSAAAPPADRAKVGVDARYRLSPGVALDVTYNTDFSHVEADTQQINLTRFSLFFPEKRDFFLENADIFHFGDVPGERSSQRRNEDTQLFYSRRIGLSEAGEPLPLRGGARLSGRAGPWSLGFLGIHQEKTDHTAANTFSVARVRRNLFAGSDVGAIFISREGGRPGDYNRSYGADLNVRAGANWTANAFWAATAGPDLRGSNEHRKISSKWDDGLLSVQMIFADIGRNFRPEVGFVPRSGVRSYQLNAGMRPRPRGRSLVREWHPHTNIKLMTDPANRTVTRDEHYALEVRFRDGSRVEVSHNPQFERLVQPFRLRSSVAIATGDYSFNEFRLAYNSDRSKLLSGSLNLTRGGFYDGDRTSLSTGATMLLKPRLAATLSYERNRIDLPVGRVRADLFILRGLYSVSPRMFTDALVQYNAETRRVLTMGRFNFTYRPLSDFSVVFNENRSTDGLLALQPTRSLMVKYTRLLQF
ncbi:MAG TPA: DUF5916 domain-containing protein [Vicinamibacterales bacterium]|nr:DUF5916 domain-containing protein [Vicinamibacterales bacterium]